MAAPTRDRAHPDVAFEHSHLTEASKAPSPSSGLASAIPDPAAEHLTIAPNTPPPGASPATYRRF